MATNRKSSTTASSAAFGEPLPSADDFAKLIEQFKLPGVDMEGLIEWQRKDMEALVEANRKAYESVKALVERRNEILQETLSLWQGELKKSGSKEALSQGTDAAKRGVQRVIDNLRELSKMEAQGRAEAWKVVQDRMQENMTNLQKLLLPK